MIKLLLFKRYNTKKMKMRGECLSQLRRIIKKKKVCGI